MKSSTALVKVTNVGRYDQVTRLGLGLALVLAPFITTLSLWQMPILQWIIPMIGLSLMVSALIKFCPTYKILGISTSSSE